jgi:glutathione synthase/RimK-type ligase-like ATP-grasp enzyme
MRACARLGRRDVHVLNLDAFPMHMDLLMAFSPGKPANFCLRLADNSTLCLEDVTAIWWHHPAPFGFPTALQHPVYRAFAQDEAATAFRGFWQASQAFWVNHMAQAEAASHKPWQLHLARQVGLTIPDTFITNSPDEARQFWQHYPGAIIYKAFRARDEAWRETRLLQPHEESLAETIRLTPVIFQRYVPAVYDLRILLVGERVFAAAAAIQHGEYQVDVRMNRHMPYAPHTLPPAILQQLPSLMHHLHLEYGAIDMRLTPDGDYVFLEINPSGAYLYVEQATGLQISRAIAEHLHRGRPPMHGLSPAPNQTLRHGGQG